MAKPDTKILTIAAAAFVIGAAGSWLTQSWLFDEPSDSMQEILSIDQRMPMIDKNFFDNFFDDEFFMRSRDPFQEMERMRKRMDEQFGDLLNGHDAGSGGIFERSFDDWFSLQFGDRTAGSIQQEEDDDYVYYHLDLGESKVNEANLTVEGNYVDIFARVEEKTEDAYSSSVSVSETRQRFPVPAGVDPASALVTHENNKITIRFTKLG
jgi:HSP20 family molecular chaperone IbpA